MLSALTTSVAGRIAYLSVFVIATRSRSPAVVVPVPRWKELPRLVLRLRRQALLLRLSGCLVLLKGLEGCAAGIGSYEGLVQKPLVGVPG